MNVLNLLFTVVLDEVREGVVWWALHLQDQDMETWDHAERDFHSCIIQNPGIPAFQHDYLAVHYFSEVSFAAQAISAPSPASQMC